jgi:RNA polymerase I-specific transcription initiation factor RRN3
MDGPASWRWFTALGKCTSLVSPGPAHRQLFTAVLAYEWVKDQQAIDAYTGFLLSLVCTTCDFLAPCLGVLVRKLLMYYDQELVEKIHDGVHALFAKMARIIPSMPTHLFPILVRHFPHRRKGPQEHLVYLKNLLRISEYLPQLRDRLIELIAQKMILIDVELSDVDFVRRPVVSAEATSQAGSSANWTCG